MDDLTAKYNGLKRELLKAEKKLEDFEKKNPGVRGSFYHREVDRIAGQIENYEENVL